MRNKGLKIKVEGPMDENEGSMSFLKRSFRSTNEGDVQITMNTKYIEVLVEALKLEGASRRGCHVHRKMEDRFKRRKEEWIR